ncbi:serine/threonine-protein kinase [Nocardia canadensis]|uniref:serine/threonine-protein kinase n=1 Tax=Nocardia canadensis TaxID=3065238 RepID=UPI0029312506|nr:protein kinase [Nocardia canadensis]
MGNSFERGNIFAGYEIEYLLGSGGMGEVYLAQDRDLPRKIALKVLPALASIDPASRKRFEREAHAVAALTHPNIVAIHAGGEERGRPWIAMAYIDGSDLDAELQRGPIAPERAVSIVSDIAEALDHAHDRGFLHRDVKPANVLLTSGRRERAILGDFGIAKSFDETSRLTGTSNMIASIRYAAPERFDPQATVDNRSDVYSLGCVLFQLLTGSLPYDGDIWQIIAARATGSVPRVSAQNASIATGFDDVIDQALAKDAGGRFESCSQLATAALRALEAQPKPPHRLEEIQQAWQEIKSATRPYGSTLLALLSGASLVRLEGWTIVLTHPSPPLMQRLETPRNRAGLLAAIRLVLGSTDYEFRWEAQAANSRR